MTKPIRPSEVANLKRTVIPSEVIEAFNELILKDFAAGSATVIQKEVVKLAEQKLKLSQPKPHFDMHWLDVEDMYRAEGWKVKYDKPAYCENYDAFFVFSKKGR